MSKRHGGECASTETGGEKKLHWSGTNNASLRSLTSQPTGHSKRKEDELTSDMINERDKCWYREDKRKGRMMVVEKKESVFFKPPAKSSKPDFWIIEIYVILLLSQKSPWERTSKAGSTDFFFFFARDKNGILIHRKGSCKNEFSNMTRCAGPHVFKFSQQKKQLVRIRRTYTMHDGNQKRRGI